MEQDREERKSKALLDLYHTFKSAEEEGETYPALEQLEGIEENFDEGQLLGRGSLKAVYRCYDQRAQRYVALARPNEGLSRQFYEHFVHEAWLTSSLSHPNIIKIYEVGLDQGGMPYFTMDLKGNMTLQKVVEQGAHLNELLEIFLKICDAVSYAHAEGVYHFDLKPENIQCDKFGEVLVCDWGLGKTSDEGLGAKNLAAIQDARNNTLYGEIKGTVGYMAPEQAQEGLIKDHRADIYALGCILYFLLSKQSPYASGTLAEKIKRTQSGEYEPLNTQVSGFVRQSLKAVVEKAMNFEVEERYASVVEMRAEVEGVLQGFASRAERPSLMRVTLLFVARHRLKFGIVMASLLLLAGLGVRNAQNAKEKDRQLEISKQLGSELDGVSLEYRLFEDTLKKGRLNLSQDLTKQSKLFLVNQAESRFPERDLKEAMVLFNKAYDIDPTNEIARQQLSTSYFVQLNTYKAKEIHLSSTLAPIQNRIDFINSLPEWRFNEDMRPEVSDVMYLFDKAISERFYDYALLEATMTYDLAFRESPEERVQILESFIKMMNREKDFECGILSDNNNITFTSSSASSIQLGRFKPKGSSILRFLEIDECRLAAKSFDLSYLEQAQIKVLDLSDVDYCIISKPVTVRGLEKVLITTQSVKNIGELNRKLKSDQEYSVVFSNN